MLKVHKTNNSYLFILHMMESDVCHSYNNEVGKTSMLCLIIFPLCAELYNEYISGAEVGGLVTS